MDITSLSFLIFVAAGLLLYWNVKTKYQWWILLACSLVFYFVNAHALTFLYLAMSVISIYGATAYFEKAASEKKKKTVLALTVTFNIGMLAVLKYSNLAISTVNGLFKTQIHSVAFLASLGISFYTLQIVSYLLDCYWGVTKREENPLKLLLFTSYFPLMISGPISRHASLSEQLFTEHRFEYDRVTTAARRIAWGFAKKLVVANKLSAVVQYTFNNVDTFSGIWVIFSAVLFVVQLYFDFSGCMDIVIGVSECFGVSVVENFKAPFLSKTVQELWLRWHITLGEWLKSYVMNPLLKTNALVTLGGKCKKRFGKQGKKIPSYIAMLAVWLLMGLWHGNSWKYIIGEGMWFWLVIVLSQILEPVFKSLKTKLHINDKSAIWKTFQVVRTVILFSIGMIFFNAADTKSSFYMIGRMFVPTGFIAQFKELYSVNWPEIGGKWGFLCIAIILIATIVSDACVYKGKSSQYLIKERPLVIRWAVYILLLFIIVLQGNFGTSSFIYFGF